VTHFYNVYSSHPGKKNWGAELFEVCARELRQPVVKPGVDTKVHPGYISASPCYRRRAGKSFL